MSFLKNWLASAGPLTGSRNPGADGLPEGDQQVVSTKSMPVFSLFAGAVPGAFVGNGRVRPASSYRDNPVVFRSVRMISEAISALPLLAYEGNREMDTHPVLELLFSPNSTETGIRFIEQASATLLLYGDCFIHLVSVDGELHELHLLHPDCIEIVTDDAGWPEAYDYVSGPYKRRFQLDPVRPEILHLQLANPVSKLRGVAPVVAASRALAVHAAASEWNAALLENSARPSGALVYSGPEGVNLTEEQYQRLKEELDNGYSGAANAGKPMLLEGGLDWKAMGYSPKDMDFIEAKNSAAREIALAFGVPPMLLGIPGDNTYANYREANRALWHQTILPFAARIAEGLSPFFASHFGEGLRIGFNKDGIEALAEERQSEWERIRTADFLTVNEKREALGYSPLPKGDVVQAEGGRV